MSNKENTNGTLNPNRKDSERTGLFNLPPTSAKPPMPPVHPPKKK